MEITLNERFGPHLASASKALDVCREIFLVWEAKPVVLDFTGVQYVSTSFANNLFFNLLERAGKEAYDRRVSVRCADPAIRGMIDRAIERKLANRATLTSYL